MSELKERPILFSAPMVLAILDGRKTQTRRVIKKPEPSNIEFDGVDYFAEDQNGDWHKVTDFCKFGRVGDRLWVRETFGFEVRNLGGTPHDKVVYRATEPEAVHCYGCNGEEIKMKWKPSIFMPRKHSRITLEITGVRVERLNDISREDALSEGIDRWDDTASITPYRNYRKGQEGEMDLHCSCPERSFMTLWESINGPGSWNDNPWVWVVEFRRATP